MSDSEPFISFGLHFMVDAYNAPADRLKDKHVLEKMLTDIPKEMGMYTICEPVVVEVGENNKKDPGGISGFVMIAESHLSFHTFPARGFVTIDVYTCQDELDTEKLLSLFQEGFGFIDVETHLVTRGARYPVSDRD